MKKQNKVLVFILAFIVAFAMVGCGSGSKYEGTWELEKAEMSGMTVSAEQIGKEKITMEIKGEEITLTFQGEKEKQKFKEIDGGIEFESSGVKMKALEDKNGMLVLDISGMKMFFKKK